MHFQFNSELKFLHDKNNNNIHYSNESWYCEINQSISNRILSLKCLKHSYKCVYLTIDDRLKCKSAGALHLLVLFVCSLHVIGVSGSRGDVLIRLRRQLYKKSLRASTLLFGSVFITVLNLCVNCYPDDWTEFSKAGRLQTFIQTLLIQSRCDRLLRDPQHSSRWTLLRVLITKFNFLFI